jgi:hypothetical protein
MRNRWIHSTFMAALGVALLLGAGIAAAEPVIEAEKLETMAKAAKTSTEHATVAKHYRLRAEAFEAKARQHETEARKLSGPRIGIDAKWPAMARKTAQREKQLAMEARRAAQENYALADKHIRMVIEIEHAE